MPQPLSFRKKPGITARTRATKSRRLKSNELREKLKVRNRDKVCRFPLCGCHTDQTMKAVTEVSHDFHKGMGGDPAGEVSIAPLMVLVCKWRHQDAPVSFHRKTIRTVYLTPDHNDGPIAWEVDMGAAQPEQYMPGTWFEVARETYAASGPGLVLEPPSSRQLYVLGFLAALTR
jgi:hypothetical protein